MSILRRIRFAFGRVKASKLNNSGSFSEALLVLDKMDGPPDEMAKLALYRADILFRKKDYSQCLVQYRLFLDKHLSYIDPKTDQDYLRLYAQFFVQQLMRKLGKESEILVSRLEVEKASVRASSLARAEFNF